MPSGSESSIVQVFLFLLNIFSVVDGDYFFRVTGMMTVMMSLVTSESLRGDCVILSGALTTCY